MVAALAVIKTSAWAPAASWATSAELPAITVVTPSWPSNTISTTSVSDEAAITTTSSSPAELLHPAASIDTDATADAIAKRAARRRCRWPLILPTAIDGRIYRGRDRALCA